MTADVRLKLDGMMGAMMVDVAADLDAFAQQQAVKLKDLVAGERGLNPALYPAPPPPRPRWRRPDGRWVRPGTEGSIEVHGAVKRQPQAVIRTSA